MVLDKNDLREIKEIVSEVVGTTEQRIIKTTDQKIERSNFDLQDKIKDTEIVLKDKVELTEKILKNEIKVSEMKLRKEIGATETKLRAEIKDSKNEIISIISHEITDLAEINRAVIKQVDKIPHFGKRVSRIETKLGLAKL